MTIHTRNWITVLLAGVWLCAVAPPTAPAADEPVTPPLSEGYDQIVADYLAGKWDGLDKSIAPTNHQLAHFTVPQKADIQYIRVSLAECRPAWWKLCKAKQEFNFRPSIWGRTMVASFDPAAKQNFNIAYNNNQASMTLMWPTDDMDNPAEAEHGFSKGDLCDLNIWNILGEAGGLAMVPIAQQVNLQDAQKLKLQRCVVFDGNLTGIYYTTPKARRWGLWLCCAYYLNKYAADPNVNCRKTIGAMFLADVAANRAKYPSITLPETAPDDKPEENLCIALKNWIEKHPWTLAEDRRIRDQIKAFAMLNQSNVLQKNLIKMPNSLVMSLDPIADDAYQNVRDAWLHKMLAGPAK